MISTSKYRILFVIILTITLASCSSSVRFTSKSIIRGNKLTKKGHTVNLLSGKNLTSIDKKIIEESKSWIGVRYSYGGNDRNGIDCSALVKNIYDSFGVVIPRTSQKQYRAAIKIKKKNAQVGDLVFFKKRGRIFHVGIYVGDNKIIHASTSSGVILQDLSNSYLSSRYAGIGRPKGKYLIK